MSCIIENNQKEILECSAGLLEDLFYEFQNILREEGLETDNEFNSFLIKLNESFFTHGSVIVDIAAIFHSSDNINFLIKIVAKTIPRIKNGLKEHAIANLWKFHAELVKYKEELEAQGK